jgi:hypothetical protein
MHKDASFVSTGNDFQDMALQSALIKTNEALRQSINPTFILIYHKPDNSYDAFDAKDVNKSVAYFKERNPDWVLYSILAFSKDKEAKQVREAFKFCNKLIVNSKGIGLNLL